MWALRGVLPTIVALTAAAITVAGCGSTSTPSSTDELGPPAATLPDVTPTLYVLPVHGTATPWHLNGEIALELQRYDIAASTQGGHGASYILYSLAEAHPNSDDLVDVTFYWDLVEPRGELIGTTSHTVPMTLAEWQSLPADVAKIAAEAASRIITIVPGARWNPTDPAVRMAAREERRKLEERRRLYRKMAARGGLGPLSKRIFVHAEQEERRARIELARVQAAANANATGSDAASGAAGIVDGEVASLGDAENHAAEIPTAETPPTVAAEQSGGDGLWAALGTFPDEADARSYWLRLRFRHARLFADRRVNLEPVATADRGTFYRVEAGPFAVPVDAMRFCLELQAAGIECTTPALVEAPAAVASDGHLEPADVYNEIRAEELDPPDTATPRQSGN